MTLQDLRQYRCITAETRRLSRRLNNLRLELATASNKDTQAKIKELYSTLETLHKKQLAKELEITKQLTQINDVQVRTSVQLHYIDGYSWNEVAREIGGGNSDNSCKQYVSRYFRKLSHMSQIQDV